MTEDRKNILIEKLSTQYSLSQISMEEYERLLKYSQDLETEKELSIFEKIIEEHSLPETKDDNIVYAIREHNKKHQKHFLLLSSKKTTGPLTNGNFTVILGDHKAIINEEDLISDETVINIKVVLGDIVIKVPKNVCVINEVFPLLAGVSVDDGLENTSGQKKVFIRGSVILGDVKVKIKKS